MCIELVIFIVECEESNVIICEEDMFYLKLCYLSVWEECVSCFFYWF